MRDNFVQDDPSFGLLSVLLEFNSLAFKNLVQRFDAEPEAGHAAGNGGDLDGFQNFTRARSQSEGAVAVELDPARPVEGAGDSDHDQLFGFSRQRAFAAEGAVDVDALELFKVFRIELGDD